MGQPTNLMKPNQTRNLKKSTYAMLLQSEEKERGLFETIVYSLLIASAVIGIWQFAHLRIPSPFANSERAATQVVSHS
jgi:hypothetical protein